MEQREKPSASLYISVTPRMKAESIKLTDQPYDQKTFRNFINQHLSYDPGSGFYSDNWMFCYEFNDRQVKSIPDQNVPFWYNQLRRIAFEEKITPSHIISLRDAFYCKQQGIDPFSPEGQHQKLIHAPGYMASGTNFGLFQDEGLEFPTVRAVDTGHGVLLYCTKQNACMEAYNSLLQHCADNFYNPNMCIDHLRFFDICPDLDQKMLMEHLESLNFNFNHHSKDFSIKDLIQHSLLDETILKEGLQIKEYDMRPLAENYSLFLNGEDLKYRAYSETLDIAILDEIAHNGYPKERLSPEWYFICSYTKQFRDLADQIVLCNDIKQMNQLQWEAKERAKLFLDQDFPQRRQLSEEQRQSISLKQTPYVDIASENFNRRPKL